MKSSRAHRSRRGQFNLRLLAWSLPLAAVTVVLLLAFRCRVGASASRSANEVDTTAVVVADDEAAVHGGTLREGELLAQLLTRLAVDDSLRHQIEMALEDAGFEFGTMHAGDSVTIACRDSLPCRLTYHLDMANEYVVELDLGSAIARLTTRPVDTVAFAIQGAVNGSLWESMVHAGADPQLVAAFCEVLRYQVNFPKDAERGDTFGLVVERLDVDGAFYRFGDILMARYDGRDASGLVFLFRPDSGPGFYCDASGRSLSRVLDFPPVANSRRTSDFGPRMHPFRRRLINHSGMDYAACYGTPVRSVADGVVSKRQWLGGYGRTVDVQHAGTDLSSRYAHLCRYGPGVKVGSRVERGEVVGYVGSTGVSTGFHLDFSVRRAGKPVDPLEVLPSGYRQVPESLMPGFRSDQDRARVLLGAGSGG